MSTEAWQGRGDELDPSTCRQLLGSATLGRIAFNGDPSPTVLPVNYTMHEGAVLFRTAVGSKLEAAARSAAATFEVDGVQADRDAGWSVVAYGHLTELADPDHDLVTAAEAIRPLVGGSRPYLVMMTVERISGRRILPDAAWVKAHGGPTWTGTDASDLMG